MKPVVYPVCGMVFLISSLSFAGDLKAPEIPDGEIRVFKSYYATKRDQPDMKNLLMQALLPFTPENYTGEIRWEGEGEKRQIIYERDAKLINGATARLTFNFDTSPDFRLRDFRNIIHAPDGTKLRDSYYDFTEPSLKYPDRTFSIYVGNMLIRSVDLAVGVRIPWNVWLSPTAVYPFRFTVVGEETITVPAGTFECYKIEGHLVPEGLTDITGIILSKALGKYYFWVEKGGSHGFVRLRWPLSSGLVPGLRTRYQTQDLVEIRGGEKKE